MNKSFKLFFTHKNIQSLISTEIYICILLSIIKEKLFETQLKLAIGMMYPDTLKFLQTIKTVA